MENKQEYDVKIVDNRYGFPLIKEVKDAHGYLRLPLNNVYSCLYEKGYIPPGYCKYGNNHFRYERWANVVLQDALDTCDYDLDGVFSGLKRLRVLSEKEAMCILHFVGYGDRKNKMYQKFIELIMRLKEKDIQDETSLREGVKWLYNQANKYCSDLLSTPLYLQPALLKARKEARIKEMPSLLADHFPLEEVKVVFDVRDLGGHARKRPYIILKKLKKGVTPRGFIDCPYAELKGIPFLEKIPQYAVTPGYELVETVKRIKKACPEITDLQLFNLITAGDYGYTHSALFDSLSRLEAFTTVSKDSEDLEESEESEESDEFEEDPYDYLMDDLKKELRVLASHDKN